MNPLGAARLATTVFAPVLPAATAVALVGTNGRAPEFKVSGSGDTPTR